MNTSSTQGIYQSMLKNRKLVLWVALVTLFAWLLREYFILVTQVEVPIRGDVRDYVAYAWNLLNHGVFSHTWPNQAIPTPDTFRGPGYPLFIAMWMAIDPQPNGWYGLVMHSQAVLGALTVTLTAFLARHWLSDRWALIAAFLVALWPHHVAATGAMLTEVVFGFVLMLAMLLAVEAIKRRNAICAAASGIVFGYAILTNMVALLFPVFVALLCWRDRAPRAALALLFCALLAPTIWGLRSTPDSAPGATPGRIVMNIVQGSWPQYHRAYMTRSHPISRDIMAAIGEEEQLLSSDLSEGLSHILHRMGNDFGYYLRWYALEKPFLLWDWDIRMGAGDVYFHTLSHSPLETNQALHATKRILEVLNPAIFVLSIAASLALLLGWIRRRPWVSTAAVLVAAFCVYVTAVHALLQAEPRYSIPYRPMQMLMLATSFAWLIQRGTGPAKSDAERHANGED